MKINYSKDGGTITYDQDDWLAGLETASSSNALRKIGNGLAFSNYIDPLRNLGYISPGFNPANVTNMSSVTSLVRNGVIKGANAYLIAGTNPAASSQGGGMVHKLGSLNAGTISTTSPFPHTIDHAHVGEAGYDIVNYTANIAGTPTLQAFFSFSDDTDWDVGIYNYTADTFNDDFMSTIPTTPLAAPYLAGGKQSPHPLIVGDDDILYVGDRNFLHAYDGSVGTDGKFYPAVLTLPQGWIITCLTKTNDRKLLIGAYYSPSQDTTVFNLGSAKVWQWNYLDLDPDFAYDLHDNYVSEIKNWNETIIAFTSGRRTQTESGTYKLQAIVNGAFQVLQTYSTGQLPIRGGVEVVQDDIYWNGSLIYFYAKNPFGDNWIFGNIGGNSQVDFGGVGMCKLFTNAFTLHTATFLSAAYDLKYLSTNFNEAGTGYGKTATPTFPERKRGRLKKIDLYFATLATGGRSFRLNTNLDQDGGQVSITDFTTVTNLKMEIINYRSDGVTPLGDFTTLQPQFIWQDGSGATACPILEKCVYHFDFININDT